MRKILEIGGGTTPYFVRYDIPMRSSDEYICLDVAESSVVKAEKALGTHASQGKACPREARFVLSDAVQIPLGDASVDEVVLSNILSAPIHYNWNEKGTVVSIKNQSGVFERPLVRDSVDGDLFYGERKAVISEALRLLVSGGTLSIYTDLLIYGQYSYEKLLEELKKDFGLIYTQDEREEERINAHNEKKRLSGDFCYCFNADVLPRSSVHRFLKL